MTLITISLRFSTCKIVLIEKHTLNFRGNKRWFILESNMTDQSMNVDPSSYEHGVLNVEAVT